MDTPLATAAKPENPNSAVTPQQSPTPSDPVKDLEKDAGRQQSSQGAQDVAKQHLSEPPHDHEDPEKADPKHFEVQWDGADDPMNPKNLPTWRKWLITLTVSTSSICVTMTSSLYTTTYGQLTEEFHCSTLVATLGLSTFVFGLGLSPMFLGPLSEFYGRRLIYTLSFAAFLIWMIPCAVAKNIATMLIARFFDGFAGSAFLSVAGGTVGDMFDQKHLQLPMMVFTASPFLGPALGPIAGGFINFYVSWRWSFWVLLIWAGVLMLAIIFFVPETYHPVLLREKARKVRKETGDDRYKAPIEIHQKSILSTVLRSLYRPFLLLTLELMVFNLCLFSAILLGILYLFFGAFHLVFAEIYGFNLWQIGLSFIGLLIGMLLAVLSDPLWHKNFLRLVANYSKETGKPNAAEPEFRLPPAIGGAPFTAIGLFIFAWTARSGIHWVAPMIGAGVFGFGTILVFSGIFTYLVAAFPLYAASALAANSFARSSFAAAFPLFGVQMYNKLTFKWASTLLAFLTLAMVPFPYIFFVYGKSLRRKSRFTANQ